MSALILNQCIDEIDFHPLLTYNEIGNFNDLNSAVEYISEVILGHKDVFKEFTKDGKNRQSSFFKKVNTKLFEPVYLSFKPLLTIVTPSFNYPSDNKYCFLFSREMIHPPCLIHSS